MCFSKSFQRGRYDFTIGRILAIRENVRLVAPTCNVGWYLKDMGVQGVKIKVSAKIPRRTIYPCSLFFAETVIYPRSWPEKQNH